MLAAKPKPKLSTLLFFIAFSLAVPAIFSFKVCRSPAMFCLLLGSLVEAIEVVADKNQKHEHKHPKRNSSVAQNFAHNREQEAEEAFWNEGKRLL